MTRAEQEQVIAKTWDALAVKWAAQGRAEDAAHCRKRASDCRESSARWAKRETPPEVAKLYQQLWGG